MKKGYPILIIFAVWCVISAIWYMFSVKGLPDNTALVKPSTTTLAIVEIIVMVTIAFLIGFWMAWAIRSGPIEQMMDDLRNSRYEIKELESTIDASRIAADEAAQRLMHAEQKAASALLSSDLLNTQVADLAATEDELRKKNKDLEVKLQQLDAEFTSAKFRLKIVESDNDEKTKQIIGLRQELERINDTPKVEHRDWSDHPFVRPVEVNGDEKDDLTEIKGIGPAFQKKLNSLDIHSFRQLSELDGEAVERLAEVIEVFPERIHRDNWIGQATRLYMKKLGKEV
jgi:predicted flap endonuclease-1-like 5' DNA nuclease